MCELCRAHPDYQEPIVRDDGAAGMIAWTWTVVLALLMTVLVVVIARADSDHIRAAAFYAYYNKTIITSDGVLDCDDNMMFAWRYLFDRGVAATPQFCTRNGEGHTYLLAGGWAIDNMSATPIAAKYVGCGE